MTIRRTMRAMLALSALPLCATAQGTVAAGQEALALAYLRIDRAVAARPLEAGAVAAFHGAFDRATLAFFTGRSAQAAATLDSLAHVAAGSEAAYAEADRAARTVLAAAPAEVRWLRTGTDSLPWRLFVPKASRGAPSTPRTLLVALHGAGTNEHAFAIAYGAGELLRVAESRDVVVAMPFTNAFMRDGGARLDALVRAVAETTPVDTTRIVLLGHSLGGIVGSQLAAARPARIAALACLASPCPATPGVSAPILDIAAESDLVIPLARIRAAVDAARTAGTPAVELRTLPGQGHTLMVGPALAPAVEWLLLQRRR
jgi:predicted esterase